MPYPDDHLYLTLHWTQQGATNEVGQTGLRFSTNGPVTQDLVNAAAGPVSTFWTAATSGIESSFLLQYIRLAHIGVDGNYVPGEVSYDYIWSSTPAGGGGATTARYPLQVALAATLITAVPRGKASKGRMYLPWYNAALDSGYKFPISNVNQRSNTLAAMINSLNDVMPGPCTIYSKVGNGFSNVVTGLYHGTRPDVQRRRAKSIVEVKGITSVITP